MKPFHFIEYLNYMNLGHTITKIASSAHFIYLGTQDGYLLLVEIPHRLEAHEFINRGQVVKSVQVFSASCGRNIPPHEWSPECKETGISFHPHQEKKNLCHNAMVDILVGPSNALQADELLCLSQAGYLVLLKCNLKDPPRFCMMGVKALAQKMYWDTRLRHQRPETHDSVQKPESCLVYNTPVLAVIKHKKLVLMSRTESPSSCPFTSFKKTLLQETPSRLVWVKNLIGLIYQESYQLYSLQSELSPLPTNIFSGIIPEDSQERCEKLNLIQTDTHEFLVMGNNRVGIFVDLMKQELASKSTLAWNSSATLAISSGPFVIGSTLDEELMIFTSQVPIVSCQTLLTNGQVIDMATLSPGLCKEENSFMSCDTHPVMISTQHGLWFLLPIPYSSQIEHFIREFNAMAALHVLNLYVPPHHLYRHRELGYIYEVLGWRSMQEQLVPMAFSYFSFTRQSVNVVGRLLALWGRSCGIFGDRSFSPCNYCGRDFWRHVLYEWLVSRGFLEKPPPWATSNELDHPSLENSISPLFSLLQDLYHTLCKWVHDPTVQHSVTLVKDGECVEHQLWGQHLDVAVEFFLKTRQVMWEAFQHRRLFPFFPTYTTLNLPDLVQHTQRMGKLWNQQPYVKRRHEDFFLEEIESLQNKDKETLLSLLHFIEAGLFLRLFDVFLITLACHFVPETSETHARLLTRIQSVLFSYDTSTVLNCQSFIDFIPQHYTDTAKHVMDELSRMSEHLFCLTSLVSHSSPMNCLLTFCHQNDFSHLSSTPLFSSSWSIFFSLHQLQFIDALEKILSTHTSTGSVTLHQSLLAFFNILCDCPQCRGKNHSLDLSFENAVKFIPPLCTRFNTLESRLSFLLLFLLGSNPQPCIDSPSLHPSPDDSPNKNQTEKDSHVTMSLLIRPNHFSKRLEIVLHQIQQLYGEQSHAYKVLLMFLAWSSTTPSSSILLSSPLRTQFIKDCFHYFDKLVPHHPTLVISRYNLLYILEVDFHYDPQEILDTILSTMGTNAKEYAPEQSICYIRLERLKDALEVLLDPEHLNCLTLCEMLCFAISTGDYPVGKLQIHHTEDDHENNHKENQEDDKQDYPHSKKGRPNQLFTKFFHPTISSRLSYKLESELSFWYSSDKEKNEALANFCNDDILLQQSSSDGLSMSSQPHSTKPHHPMLFLLVEVLLGKWNEYDILCHETKNQYDYFLHFYRYCVLVLLHKYVKHPELDFIRVLQILPESWPLNCLASYITHGFRALASRESSELIRESLTRISDLKSSGEWTNVVSQSVEITRESTCPICSKRLALPKTKSSASPGLPTKSIQNSASFLAWNIRTGECGHMHCFQQETL